MSATQNKAADPTLSMAGTIMGVVAAVPKATWGNADVLGAPQAAKLTGIHERRWAAGKQSTESLCLDAARRLMRKLDVYSDKIKVVVYVTQTPGMQLPSTAFDIHRELKLPEDCMVVPVNWSCAGYVLGLCMTLRLLGPGEHGLLLVGDTISKILDKRDSATAPIFGDAGSATMLLRSGPVQNFWLGADGNGNSSLSCKNAGEIKMVGPEVFNFTIDRVPPMIEKVRSLREPELWLMHQANEFMLKHIAKKCAIDERLVPMNLRRFGNTSCASIPLLMADEARGPLLGMLDSPDSFDHHWVGMLGFGAGWAWAGALVNILGLQVLELLEV